MLRSAWLISPAFPKIIGEPTLDSKPCYDDFQSFVRQIALRDGFPHLTDTFLEGDKAILEIETKEKALRRKSHIIWKDGKWWCVGHG
jgi:hypothetical protein